MRFVRIGGALALLAFALQPAAGAAVTKSDNVAVVAHVPYWGGDRKSVV